MMEGQGENDELYPIAVLMDELKVSELCVPAVSLSSSCVLTSVYSMTTYFSDSMPFIDCPLLPLPWVRSEHETNSYHFLTVAAFITCNNLSG
jgi:hypothetical protein